MLVAALCGCNSRLDDETTLSFIGDSNIARWDLQNSFSSWITYNLGVSASGIDYIEEMAGKLAGRNAVVLFGTNDNYLLIDPDSRRDYEARYIDAILNLGADKVYLYEVLPRNFTGEGPLINQCIMEFNKDICDMVSVYPQIVYLKVFDDFIEKDGDLRWEYYNDGLHLSPQGYEILASALFKNI